MADPDYHRLTRAKSRSMFGFVATSRSSLWVGRDHLLQIDTTGYTETYKRFYFRDIQALVLCKTDTWLFHAVVFAALASLFGLIAFFGGNPIAAWIFGSVAGVFALCLLFDLVAGPTSRSYLRTAVQKEMLVSLNRLRRTRRVFERLRPLITTAQGELTPRTDFSEVQGQPGAPLASGTRGQASARGFEASNPPTKEQA